MKRPARHSARRALRACSLAVGVRADAQRGPGHRGRTDLDRRPRPGHLRLRPQAAAAGGVGHRDRHPLPGGDEGHADHDQRRAAVPQRARRSATGRRRARSSPTASSATRSAGPHRSQVPMAAINEYDARGAWQRSRDGRDPQLRPHVEDGEWRIDEAPRRADRARDVVRGLLPPRLALLLRPDRPDPGARAGLRPRGRPARLLPGPRACCRRPGTDPAHHAHLRAAGLHARPSRCRSPSAGIAEVSLDGRRRPRSTRRPAQLMLTQLIWTLRQEQRIRAVRLTIGERGAGPARRGDPGRPRRRRAPTTPPGAQASGDLFGLVDGRVVRGSIGSLLRHLGPDGRRAARRALDRGQPRRCTGSPASPATAASVLVAPVDDDGQRREVASGARDLLPPGLGLRRPDVAGRPRGRPGARPASSPATSAARRRGAGRQRPRRPSTCSSRATAAAWSRSCVRRGGDRVVASRVLHDERGRRAAGHPGRSRSTSSPTPSDAGDPRHRLAHPDRHLGADRHHRGPLPGARRSRSTGRPGELVTSGSGPRAGRVPRAGQLAGRGRRGVTPSPATPSSTSPPPSAPLERRCRRASPRSPTSAEAPPQAGGRPLSRARPRWCDGPGARRRSSTSSSGARCVGCARPGPDAVPGVPRAAAGRATLSLAAARSPPGW